MSRSTVGSPPHNSDRQGLKNYLKMINSFRENVDPLEVLNQFSEGLNVVACFQYVCVQRDFTFFCELAIFFPL